MFHILFAEEKTVYRSIPFITFYSNSYKVCSTILCRVTPVCLLKAMCLSWNNSAKPVDTATLILWNSPWYNMIKLLTYVLSHLYMLAVPFFKSSAILHQHHLVSFPHSWKICQICLPSSFIEKRQFNQYHKTHEPGYLESTDHIEFAVKFSKCANQRILSLMNDVSL